MKVNPINAAPVLVGGGSSILSGSGTTFTANSNFTTILEDISNASNVGDAVSTLLDANSVTDEEQPNASGFPTKERVQLVAVTSVNNSNGQWQFSTNGSTFTNFGSPSQSSARLLDGSNSDHKIRFVPNLHFNTAIASPVGITYRAVDDTHGEIIGGVVNASSTGGTTAFSVGQVTKNITITPVNDAPVVNVSNQSVNEDAGAQSVAGFTQDEGGEVMKTARRLQEQLATIIPPCFLPNPQLQPTALSPTRLPPINMELQR